MIPKNVVVRIDRRQPGWSYPLKSADLLEVPLGHVPVEIHFVNEVDPLVDARPLVVVRYFGRHYRTAGLPNRFLFQVRPAPSSQRHFLRQLIRPLLPRISNFICDAPGYKLLNHDMTEFMVSYGRHPGFEPRFLRSDHLLLMTNHNGHKRIVWSKKLIA